MKATFALNRSMLGALAMTTLLIGPLGCAGVDESGELVGEAAEALSTPVLVANPSSIDFGTISYRTASTVGVKLTNTGDATAIGITLFVPPDPCRIVHDPVGYLEAGASSNAMQIMFAPTTPGDYSGTFVVQYRGAGGETLSTLSIPYTGTAY